MAAAMLRKLPQFVKS